MAANNGETPAASANETGTGNTLHVPGLDNALDRATTPTTSHGGVRAVIGKAARATAGRILGLGGLINRGSEAARGPTSLDEMADLAAASIGGSGSSDASGSEPSGIGVSPWHPVGGEGLPSSAANRRRDAAGTRSEGTGTPEPPPLAAQTGETAATVAGVDLVAAAESAAGAEAGGAGTDTNTPTENATTTAGGTPGRRGRGPRRSTASTGGGGVPPPPRPTTTGGGPEDGESAATGGSTSPDSTGSASELVSPTGPSTEGEPPPVTSAAGTETPGIVGTATGSTPDVEEPTTAPTSPAPLAASAPATPVPTGATTGPSPTVAAPVSPPPRATPLPPPSPRVIVTPATTTATLSTPDGGGVVPLADATHIETSAERTTRLNEATDRAIRTLFKRPDATTVVDPTVLATETGVSATEIQEIVASLKTKGILNPDSTINRDETSYALARLITPDLQEMSDDDRRNVTNADLISLVEMAGGSSDPTHVGDLLAVLEGQHVISRNTRGLNNINSTEETAQLQAEQNIRIAEFEKAMSQLYLASDTDVFNATTLAPLVGVNETRAQEIIETLMEERYLNPDSTVNHASLDQDMAISIAAYQLREIPGRQISQADLDARVLILGGRRADELKTQIIREFVLSPNPDGSFTVNNPTETTLLKAEHDEVIISNVNSVINRLAPGRRVDRDSLVADFGVEDANVDEVLERLGSGTDGLKIIRADGSIDPDVVDTEQNNRLQTLAREIRSLGTSATIDNVRRAIMGSAGGDQAVDEVLERLEELHVIATNGSEYTINDAATATRLLAEDEARERETRITEEVAHSVIALRSTNTVTEDLLKDPAGLAVEADIATEVLARLRALPNSFLVDSGTPGQFTVDRTRLVEAQNAKINEATDAVRDLLQPGTNSATTNTTLIREALLPVAGEVQASANRLISQLERRGIITLNAGNNITINNPAETTRLGTERRARELHNDVNSYLCSLTDGEQITTALLQQKLPGVEDDMIDDILSQLQTRGVATPDPADNTRLIVNETNRQRELTTATKNAADRLRARASRTYTQAEAEQALEQFGLDINAVSGILEGNLFWTSDGATPPTYTLLPSARVNAPPGPTFLERAANVPVLGGLGRFGWKVAESMLPRGKDKRYYAAGVVLGAGTTLLLAGLPLPEVNALGMHIGAATALGLAKMTGTIAWNYHLQSNFNKSIGSVGESALGMRVPGTNVSIDSNQTLKPEEIVTPALSDQEKQKRQKQFTKATVKLAKNNQLLVADAAGNQVASPELVSAFELLLSEPAAPADKRAAAQRLAEAKLAQINEFRDKYQAADRKLRGLTAGWALGSLGANVGNLISSNMTGHKIFEFDAQPWLDKAKGFRIGAGEAPGGIGPGAGGTPDGGGVGASPPPGGSPQSPGIPSGVGAEGPPRLPGVGAGIPPDAIEKTNLPEAQRLYQERIAAAVGAHLDIRNQVVDEVLRKQGLDPSKLATSAPKTLNEMRLAVQHIMEQDATYQFNDVAAVDVGGKSFLENQAQLAVAAKSGRHLFDSLTKQGDFHDKLLNEANKAFAGAANSDEVKKLLADAAKEKAAKLAAENATKAAGAAAGKASELLPADVAERIRTAVESLPKDIIRDEVTRKGSTVGQMLMENGYPLSWSSKDAPTLAAEVALNYDTLHKTWDTIAFNLNIPGEYPIKNIGDLPSLVELAQSDKPGHEDALKKLIEALHWIPANQRFKILTGKVSPIQAIAIINAIKGK